MDRGIVKGQTFSSEFQRFDQDLVFIKRDHFWPRSNRQIDVFGKFWWLFLRGEKAQDVKVFANKQWVRRPNEYALLCPPFSMVQWQLDPGPLQWEAYISPTPLPLKWNQGAVLIPWRTKSIFARTSDLIAELDAVHHQEPLLPLENVSAIGLRTKKYIDSHFTEDLSIQTVANNLGFHFKVMSRHFYADFGLSPSLYRNKLRIMNAKCQMLFQDISVLDAAVSSGFSTPGGFNKAFHKIMGLAPSHIPNLKKQN